MIALVAADDLGTAVRLGGSMVALQASIGALNDLVDAPADAGRKPRKPIPSGMVSPRVAQWVVVLAATTGLLLAAPSGPTLLVIALLVIAVLVLAVGYAYDLWAKGTGWSWLPFAVGIPLLPVFAWLGATGQLPTSFLLLVPVAMVAGAALAIANARADLERDLAAGQASVATRLGNADAWRLSGGLFVVVAAIAIGSLGFDRAAPLRIVGALASSAVILVGVAWGHGPATTPTRRERSWEIQAIGVALLAASWLAGLGDLG